MLLCATLAAGALAAGGTPAGLAAPVPRRALLRDLACHQAASPLARYVSVTALMRPLAGTRHMRMRFSLLAMTTGQRAFHALLAGRLGKWLAPPDPTLGQRPGDRWLVSEPVHGLQAGVYRFRVRFAWIGAGGALIASAVRSSGLCVQRDAAGG